MKGLAKHLPTLCADGRDVVYHLILTFHILCYFVLYIYASSVNLPVLIFFIFLPLVSFTFIDDLVNAPNTFIIISMKN